MQQEQKLSYSPEAAAAATDMNRSAIYRAIQSGELKSYKVGRLRRITRQALENYVAQLERGAA
ncbi:helix-turn-helix domain-containing protein [Thermomonas carbonis]|uniref:Helix-turn-helix domain-containing protein n=1 Tax=Thermomonas carbonis TaxID=1463158 RepID=A0A7G9SPT9_9GAMM|nr:helix-turn-helix domain-containing protein [Thermomonas carbonis]QNN69864.1 helix-turn-helix domain-containing protein [Thermomonas carbonis]GHB95961.1 hypothetical protein GCM10010080_04650 [Thermomonas carbonis]